MNIGEKIYKLRNQHNLSQGDMAEKLGVSRQSISKWENNNSTPDLDKIIKLAEIFGISVDDLVKNEEFENTSSPAQLPTRPLPEPAENNFKKIGKGLLIAGILVIFAFPLLGLGITGVFVAIPLFACSIVFYKAKSNYSVWCLWAVIPLTDIFIRAAMGISWSSIKMTFSWDYSLNYWRLAIAWVQFAAIVFLIIFSAIKLSKNSYEINQKFKKDYLASGIGFVFLEIIGFVSSAIVTKIALDGGFGHIPDAIAVSISGASGVFEWLKFYLLSDVLAKTIFIFRNKKQKNSDNYF